MKWLKRIFFLLLIVGVAYGGYFVYFETSLLNIQTITYTEHTHMNESVIYAYTGYKVGDSYFSIRTQHAKERIETHPYVLSAEVAKHFPSSIAFNMTYRVHKFNLSYSDIVLSLDETLNVLSVLDQQVAGYTVEGFSFDSFSTGQLINVQRRYVLENIVLLIELLEKSHIQADPTIEYLDDSILIKVEGIRVRFGNGDQIEKKFNAFVSIFEALKTEGIASGTIDVSTDGLPVYRPFGE